MDSLTPLLHEALKRSLVPVCLAMHCFMHGTAIACAQVRPYCSFGMLQQQLQKHFGSQFFEVWFSTSCCFVKHASTLAPVNVRTCKYTLCTILGCASPCLMGLLSPKICTSPQIISSATAFTGTGLLTDLPGRKQSG